MATIRQALAGAGALRTLGDSGRLDAELLLAHALGKPREYLFSWPERELNDDEMQAFAAFCARRGGGEPTAYILGRQAFWDMELLVSPSVLIPRPETELLVESAIGLLEIDHGAGAEVLDLGTGSGAIALALASHNRRWRLTAVDASESALAVARENGRRLSLENVEFRKASWCDGLPEGGFDLIAANPPYVEAGDEHLQQGGLPFEPIAALVAADGGLADIRDIVDQSRRCLRAGAWLLLEHGFEQGEAVRNILLDAGYEAIECLQDLAGLDRVTRAQYAARETQVDK